MPLDQIVAEQGPQAQENDEQDTKRRKQDGDRDILANRELQARDQSVTGIKKGFEDKDFHMVRKFIGIMPDKHQSNLSLTDVFGVASKKSSIIFGDYVGYCPVNSHNTGKSLQSFYGELDDNVRTYSIYQPYLYEFFVKFATEMDVMFRESNVQHSSEKIIKIIMATSCFLQTHGLEKTYDRLPILDNGEADFAEGVRYIALSPQCQASKAERLGFYPPDFPNVLKPFLITSVINVAQMKTGVAAGYDVLGLAVEFENVDQRDNRGRYIRAIIENVGSKLKSEQNAIRRFFMNAFISLSKIITMQPAIPWKTVTLDALPNAARG